MKGQRSAPVRDTDERRRSNRQKPSSSRRRQGEAPARKRRGAPEQRPQRGAPQTAPMRRVADTPTRAKNAGQAKARAKARKAKAPKVVRPPLWERLIARIDAIELNPRTLLARVPFVVLVIAALGVGLGVTLWLSTDAAERSYQLGHARELNQALLQQKEALERDVLEAQAAPALAEAARELGMIPSRDTAHLVQDPTGAWLVVGTPRPAEGVPPPPLNTPLPEENPTSSSAPERPAAAPPAPRVVDPREMVVRVPPSPEGEPHITGPATPLVVPGPQAPLVAPGPQAPVPAPVPAEGLPHLATQQLPAQPGAVGGFEQVGPPPGPEVPAAVPQAPVAVPAPIPGGPV